MSETTCNYLCGEHLNNCVKNHSHHQKDKTDECACVQCLKPRTRFCWHCARKLQGNHFAEHETGNGKVIVHKDCLKILEGGFNHVIAVDDAKNNSRP